MTEETNLLHQAITIDDEHTPETNAFFFDKHPIVAANLVCCIAQQRYVDVTKAAVLAGNVLPVPERMLRINRNESNIAVPIFELLVAVLEGNDFSRTDKRESSRYEK